MAIDDTAFSPGCVPSPDRLPYTNETTTRRSTTTSTSSSTTRSSDSPTASQAPTGSTPSKQSESSTKPGTGPTQPTVQPGTTRTPLPTVCPSDYCLNGGTCIYTDDFGFRCKCKTGYIGQKCAEKIQNKDSDSNSTSLIVGILIPGLVLIGFLGFVIYRFNQVNSLKDIFK